MTFLSTITGWFARPLPTFEPGWEPVLERGFHHWRLLDATELERMRMLVARFFHENDWEAARGMDLTADVKVLISAQASMLLLGLEIDEYFDVTSVIVHRSTVRLTGTHRSAAGTMTQGTQHLAGQATPKGPVVLAWNAVTRGATQPASGQNVVYHEFAHRLDMLDGVTDGTPPLGSDAATARWAEVCTPAFERVKAGESILRSYAATNPAEFFAVATETFFNRPLDLLEHEKDLYDVLRSFFQQDTARRMRTAMLGANGSAS
jgi:Mlc titration factor MtfA (ptsG expression regulator)